MTEQILTLITHNPSFNHLVYIIISKSKDAIISKESIIVTFSNIKHEVAKFDLAVNYVNINTGLTFEQNIMSLNLLCFIPIFIEIDTLVPGNKIFKYLYHIWARQPSWSCDQHHVNSFSFPCT